MSLTVFVAYEKMDSAVRTKKIRYIFIQKNPTNWITDKELIKMKRKNRLTSKTNEKSRYRT